MENKINIAKLLEDCPNGMELDCTMYDSVTLLSVNDNENITFPIRVLREDGHCIALTKYGQYTDADFAKCVIFPKGKTTWEGFQIPFKDGDIVATSSGTWIGITTGGKSCEFMPTYCVIKGDGKFEAYLDKKETWQFFRFATEEEKQKLFQAIKNNGYKWNEETKTLEKLVEPRFKIGNRIKSKINQYEYTIIDITKNNYIVRYKTDEFNYHVSFYDEDNYDLIPDKFDITKLKPFDRVLCRNKDNEVWTANIYSHYDSKSDSPFTCIGWVELNAYITCIPYIGNEHLLGTTNDCDEYFKNW